MERSPALDGLAGGELQAQEARIIAALLQLESSDRAVQPLVPLGRLAFQKSAQRRGGASLIHLRRSPLSICSRMDGSRCRRRAIYPRHNRRSPFGFLHRHEARKGKAPMETGGMIAQTIQLALAPVFVLVAIGNILNGLSSRLGRVVDRSRELQRRHASTSGAEHDAVVREMRLTDRRISLIGQAILLLVLSGLSIGLVCAMLFLEELLRVNMQQFAAGAFLLAIVLLMWALLLFMRETRAAAAALRIPENYLELERQL